MFRFFRTLRRKLLEEDKFRKYMWYAVGEVFLVVIGILIALQVNNWNEERKERQQELSYLTSIKTDLLVDLEDLESIKAHKNLKIDAILELLELSDPQNNTELLNFENKLYDVLIWQTFTANNNSFIELISSGNLNIISNDEIKNGLLDNDKIVKDIDRVVEHMRKDYESYLYDPTFTMMESLLYFDYDGFKNLNSFPEDSTVVFSGNELQLYLDQAAALINDQKLKNGLKLAAVNQTYLISQYTNLEANIRVIIEHINEELKN